MFNDRRIIAAPKPIRKMIAWFITTSRHKEAKHNYALIGGKSPIVGYTKGVVDALSQKIDADVHYVMRYTPPFTDEVLAPLKDYDAIYAIPLYPHFSSTTTLSSFDVLYEEADKLGIRHKIHTVDRYYRHPDYIASTVARIKEALGDDNPAEFELIFPAHGVDSPVFRRQTCFLKKEKSNHLSHCVYH
jgi:ferrochelatase